MKKLLFISLRRIVLFFFMILAFIQLASAQSQELKYSAAKDCDSIYKGWKGDPDTVSVYADTSLTAAEKDSVKKAAKKWNDAGCKPKLKIVDTPPGKITIKENNSLPDTTAGLCTRYYTPSDNKTTRAEIDLKTNSGLPFGELVTHELGHCFGLKDTDPDSNKTDVMKASGSNGNGDLSPHDKAELALSANAMNDKRYAVSPAAPVPPGSTNFPVSFPLAQFYPPPVAAMANIIVTPMNDTKLFIGGSSVTDSSLTVFVTVEQGHWAGIFSVMVSIEFPPPYEEENFIGLCYTHPFPVPHIPFQCDLHIEQAGNMVVADWSTSDYPTFPFNVNFRSELVVDNSEVSYTKGNGAYYLNLIPGTHQLTLYVDDYKGNMASVTKQISVSDWVGTISSDWNNNNNWSAGVPTSITNAIIPAGTPYMPHVNIIDAKCGNLTVNSGGLLTIDPDRALTLSGSLTNNGSVIIHSSVTGASSLFVDGKLFGTGSYKVQRFINANAWHLISSPVVMGTGANGHTLVPAGGHAWLRPYDNGTGWLSHITDLNFQLVPTTGYALWLDMDKTIEFTGNINNETYYNINLAAGNGWNLAGNPYTFSLDWDSVYASNPAMNSSVWFWDQTYGSSAGNYGTYNANGGSSVPPSVTSIIPPEQGFFVKDNPLGILSLAKEHSTTSSHPYYKSANTDVFRLKAHKGIYSDELAVYIHPSAENGFDAFDSEKLFSDHDSVPEIYSLTGSGDKLIINTVLSVPAIIPIEIKTSQPGNITLSAYGYDDFDASVAVFLEDILLSTFQDLKTNPVYSFNALQGNNSGRFALHLVANQGIAENDQGSFVIYSYMNNVYVDNHGGDVITAIEVRNIQGALIYKKQCHLEDPLINIPLDAADGCYIVRVTSSRQAKSAKVIIHD